MKLLVTAGPTREPIDPARFISNRSSGKMGYAVAAAAVKNGHSVTLISGPVSLGPPAGVRCVNVITAAEMLRAVEKNIRQCDALVMSAAVSDFRPAACHARKIKKHAFKLLLPLKRNPDILMRMIPRKEGRVFVGFAAETGAPEREALRKLRRKNLDLVVANDIGRKDSGFEADTNLACFIDACGKVKKLPLMSKARLGGLIVRWIERKLAARRHKRKEKIK